MLSIFPYHRFSQVIICQASVTPSNPLKWFGGKCSKHCHYLWCRSGRGPVCHLFMWLSFIGTQPLLYIYLGSMTALVLPWAGWVVAAEITRCPKKVLVIKQAPADSASVLQSAENLDFLAVFIQGSDVQASQMSHQLGNSSGFLWVAF